MSESRVEIKSSKGVAKYKVKSNSSVKEVKLFDNSRP